MAFSSGRKLPGIPPTLTKPDAPAVASGQKGTYKDSKSRVKRQGAQFRISGPTFQ